MAGMTLQLAAPRSIDDLLVDVEDSEGIPFWAQIWDSAFGLIDYLAKMGDSIQITGRRMLELGCGVGAVGCAAAAMGWDVTLTDGRPEAVVYARRNLRENGLDGSVIEGTWNVLPVTGPFDWIVGSDILYEPRFHPDLAGILERLAQQGTTVILSDPGRSYAIQFAAEREREGWCVDLEFQPGKDGPISIFSFRR